MELPIRNVISRELFFKGCNWGSRKLPETWPWPYASSYNVWYKRNCTMLYISLDVKGKNIYIIKGGVFCLQGGRRETHRMSYCYWEIFLPGPRVEVGRKFFFRSRLSWSLFSWLLQLFGLMRVLLFWGKVVKCFHVIKKRIDCYWVDLTCWTPIHTAQNKSGSLQTIFW